MRAGCVGACGSPGWRPRGSRADSGRGHMGPAQAWAELRFNLTRAGAVRFVYGLDCAPGAAFAAYVDATQAPHPPRTQGSES